MPRCATRGRGLLCFRTTACFFFAGFQVAFVQKYFPPLTEEKVKKWRETVFTFICMCVNDSLCDKLMSTAAYFLAELDLQQEAVVVQTLYCSCGHRQ